MYSQNDEEKWIVDFYKDRIGRFLDIGAHDGKSFSCTYRLVELGWSGVCVDPSPTAFVELQKLHNDNSKIEVVNCAVDVDSEIKIFYHMGTGGYISTLSEDFVNEWPQHKKKYKSMYLKTIIFNELFESFGYDFDFIKIDAEGMDFKIFKTIPFNSLLNLNMFCIEFCKSNDLSDIIKLGEMHGFSTLVTTKHNLIMTRSV